VLSLQLPNFLPRGIKSLFRNIPSIFQKERAKINSLEITRSFLRKDKIITSREERVLLSNKSNLVSIISDKNYSTCYSFVKQQINLFINRISQRLTLSRRPRYVPKL